jgi:hypothetical protein
MVWLFSFILWSLSVAFRGPKASRPAAIQLLYLVAALNLLVHSCETHRDLAFPEQRSQHAGLAGLTGLH